MRQFSRALPAILTIFLLTACSSSPPPAGRWYGAYEDSALIIVARLEIDSAGVVRVSAPNATITSADMSKVDRADLRAKLEDGLASSWPSVAPLPLEFDGHAFHKPGGVAPQLEWNASAGRMTLVYYANNRPAIRVALDPVKNFDT